ncbi:MAG: hypothetical protein ABL914_01325 [Novosphingobium sp.]|uniref:hypothetical protein n=1 Tax=Novosphingobium sp. TaxID=1874826 RepID=UPI0032BE4BE0
MTEPSCPPLVAAPSRLIAQASPTHWSRAKMARFLGELAATHSVSAAARVVGMSRQSAYRLKARLRDEPFDLAWEAAVQSGYDALHQAALDRALNGVEVPVHHKGELIGTRRQFDERLTIFLLSARNRHFVPFERQSTDARREWAGYFADLLVRVRSGQPMPNKAEEWRAEIEALEAEFGSDPAPDNQAGHDR